MRTIARILAHSFIFGHARHLLERNKRDWNYPFSKWQKLLIGFYMILHDYSEGMFPPQRKEEKETFEAEIACYNSVKTMCKTPDKLLLGEMAKPFWIGSGCVMYLGDYIQIQSSLHERDIKPPASLLEVGCGSGWIAEFFAASGFQVLATTLDSAETATVELRKKSLEIKGLPAALEFRASAMEYIHENVRDLPPFNVVYVYEALHHAYDWRKAIKSFYEVLAPNGWCFIFNEPNIMHTFKSYRVGRLLNTHEIGMSSSQIRGALKQAGFTRIQILKNRLHWWTRPIWIAAQKRVLSI
jgi:ubiquinone/menaquinone biosynthesis C-methylase UbiE